VLLARVQYQSGQQGEALRTIHQLKGALAEHLGIDPGPDVVALETSILRQEPHFRWLMRPPLRPLVRGLSLSRTGGAQFIRDSHDVAIASYDGGAYR
jgi:transcriptional activator